MKNYRITVNGNTYDVTVEESGAPAAAAAPAPAAAPAAPAAPAAAPAAPAPAGGGSVEITSSVPGKVLRIEAQAGAQVASGDAIIVLEAMKMEVPVVAPQGGTVVSVNVSAGDMVESGDVLATMD